MSNSTFSGNSVPYSNGSGNGGAINTDNGGTITNCTVTNNSAAGNGSAGGILTGYNISLSNNIVAANTNNATQPDIVRISGTVTSNGYNLIGNPGTITFNGTGDQKGTPAAPLNPQVLALAFNGGPTQTHALGAGSPAIDAGNSALTIDQRGSKRPVDIAAVANVGNGGDIGAFELDAAQSGPNLVVNKTADTDDGTCSVGDCTLREAMNAASGNGAANNTITFDATTFASRQTITLSNGLLPLINTDISINGPTASGAGVTIDANGQSGIFGVIGGTSTFANLSLTGGDNRNPGGAIQQGGASRLTLNFCTLSGNTAYRGGAIFTNAELTLNSCTLSGNRANIGGRGGGIYNSGTFTLNSCTLSGNSAGSGGGIFTVSGTLSLNNSLVAGNTANSNPDLSGTINTGDYNLIGNTQGTIFSGNPAHNITNVDPMLGALADNGGPTQTFALQAGSPAIDAGIPAFTLDQRGRFRPVDLAVANASGGNGSDIGAFELNETPQSGANFVVNQTGDIDDGVCGPTNCTLREAINAANGNADQSAITFDATAFAAPRKTITVSGQLPNITTNTSITAPSAGVNVVNTTNNSGGLFTIRSGVVNLSNLTISSNFTGVYTQGGTTTLQGCTLQGSNIGIQTQGGDITAQYCTITGNGNAGIVGAATVQNCTITGNGTGIVNIGSATVNLSNSIVVGNSSGNIFGPLATDDHNITSGTAAAAGLDPNGLQENGGPTPTIALLANSPVINAGSNALIPNGVTTDGRGAGFARIRGGTVDIGAFEFPNDLPVVSDIAKSLSEDATLSFAPADFTNAFSDPDNGDTLSKIKITSLPTHGTLRLGANAVALNQEIALAATSTLSYEPDADFNGADAFGYNGADAFSFAATGAQVRLQVLAINDEPTISAIAGKSTREDTATLPIAFTIGDVETAAASLSVTALSSNTKLVPVANIVLDGSGANRSATITPALNESGTTTITLRVSDGTARADSTFTLQVLAVNDAPVATPQSLGTGEDTPLAITLGASDVDSNTFSFEIVSGPGHGTLSGSGSARTYTPARDFTGSDSFTYRANDGALNSNTEVIAITIGGENDAPVAQDDTASTDEDTPLDIQVLVNDTDAEKSPLRVVRVSTTSAAHGSVSINQDGTLRFVPEPNFNGAASFGYTISDGALENSATVMVQVLAINDAPIAASQSITTAFETEASITLSASDIDSQSLSFAIVSGPIHGTLSGSGAGRIYTPTAGFSGADAFTFKANDGAADSNVATVTLQVLADGTPTPTPTPGPTQTPNLQNRAPVAVADFYSTRGPLQVLAAGGVLANDTDADGNPLRASLSSVPAHGTISFQTDGSFVYTPAVGYAGRDAFSYKASDGQAESAPVAVALQVAATPDVTAPALALAGGNPRVERRLIPLRGSAFDVYVLRNGPVVSSGLKSVVVRLQRFGGDYYNGKSYQKAPFNLPTQQLGRSFFTVPSSVMPPLSQAPGGRYKWSAIARDNAGNISQATQFMLVDSTPPAVAIDTPPGGADGTARLSKLEAVSGKVSEPARMDLVLRRGDGQYWNGRAYQAAFTFQSVRATSNAWSFPASSLPQGANLAPGRYTITVRATDGVGNVGSATRAVIVSSLPAG